VGTAFDRLAIEPDMARLVMAGAPLPRDRGAKAVSRAGRNYITKRWERAGETAGGREASDAGGSRKKNKTETNLGKGACQTARSGLRILQAGRFVIEAAFLIPGSAKASGLQRRASYQPRKGRLTVADRYGASRRPVGACYASCLAILPETARAGSIRARGCPMLRSQREASFGSRSTPSPL